MPALQTLFAAVFVGTGATAVMDLWLALLKRVGVPTGNLDLVGRWVAHMTRGRFLHASIARAERAGNERVIGWVTHYAVGIAFASVLLALQGADWVHRPTLVPAVVTGLATVALPLFVMQPAMGAGFASSNTPTPLANCVRSLANHAVFGVGLFLSAIALNGVVG